MNKNWYAVFTRLGCEKKVAAQLVKRKVEYFLPLNCTVQNEADKERIFYKPLFPSCVFVQTTKEELPPIKRLECVISLLYWLNKPAIIMDDEMDMLQHFLSEHKTVFLSKIAVSTGQLCSLSKEVIRFAGDGKIERGMIKLVLPSLGYELTARSESIEVKDRLAAMEAEFLSRPHASLN